MKISVIGAGNIGGTLGKAWAAAGHAVQFGVRDANAPKCSGCRRHQRITAASVSGLGLWRRIAIPATAELARTAGAAFDGKTVIDASNRRDRRK